MAETFLPEHSRWLFAPPLWGSTLALRAQAEGGKEQQ